MVRLEVSDECFWDFSPAVGAAVDGPGGIDSFDGKPGVELTDEVCHRVGKEAFDTACGEFAEDVGEAPLVVLAKPAAVVSGE